MTVTVNVYYVVKFELLRVTFRVYTPAVIAVVGINVKYELLNVYQDGVGYTFSVIVCPAS